MYVKLNVPSSESTTSVVSEDIPTSIVTHTLYVHQLNIIFT